MPVTLTSVQPGDVISAERWNALLSEVIDLTTQIQQLSGSIGGGTVTVPNVFGLTLTQAKAIITNPAQQLALGNVLDAHRQLDNPSAVGSGALLVINQIPAAGAKTIPGAGVSLVVAATPGAGGPPPSNLPVISELFPTPSKVDVQVEIRGQRFAPLNTDNIVTFDNVPTPAPPSALSNVGSLFVTVPKGIPGAPTAEGQANKTGVVVRVTTPNGMATFDTAIIAPPPADPIPTITGVSPAIAVVGGVLNVTGQNFAATAAGNQVRFDNNPALTVTPSSATALNAGAIRLAVTIPNGISGLTQVGNDRSDVAIAVLKVGAPVPNPLQTFPARIVKAS